MLWDSTSLSKVFTGQQNSLILQSEVGLGVIVADMLGLHLVALWILRRLVLIWNCLCGLLQLTRCRRGWSNSGKAPLLFRDVGFDPIRPLRSSFSGRSRIFSSLFHFKLWQKKKKDLSKKEAFYKPGSPESNRLSAKGKEGWIDRWREWEGGRKRGRERRRGQVFGKLWASRRSQINVCPIQPWGLAKLNQWNDWLPTAKPSTAWIKHGALE